MVLTPQSRSRLHFPEGSGHVVAGAGPVIGTRAKGRRCREILSAVRNLRVVETGLSPSFLRQLACSGSGIPPVTAILTGIRSLVRRNGRRIYVRFVVTVGDARVVEGGCRDHAGCRSLSIPPSVAILAVLHEPRFRVGPVGSGIGFGRTRHEERKRLPIGLTASHHPLPVGNASRIPFASEDYPVQRGHERFRSRRRIRRIGIEHRVYLVEYGNRGIFLELGFEDPRVQVLKNERVVGSVLRPDFIVHLVELGEAGIEVGVESGGFRRGSGLFRGFDLEFDDELVEDTSSGSVRKLAQLGVGGGIAGGVWDGFEVSAGDCRAVGKDCGEGKRSERYEGAGHLGRAGFLRLGSRRDIGFHRNEVKDQIRSGQEA